MSKRAYIFYLLVLIIGFGIAYVSGIRFVYLSALDVVRHPVVQRIIERYENDDETQDD